MEHDRIWKKKAFFDQYKHLLSPVTMKSYMDHFEIEYTHHSTAIEGNTLSLIETKVVLEDGLSIGGKRLREIYEVVNHHKAYQYVKKCVSDKRSLTEVIVKDIHAILMENMMTGGVYRMIDVRISGAKHRPPTPNEMYRQMKYFWEDLSHKTEMNPIELAAWTHAEFVKIHPFEDGNGRTSRLMLNYQLMMHGCLPVSIPKESRLDYFNTLESYAVDANLVPFTELVATLEEEQLDLFIGLIEQS